MSVKQTAMSESTPEAELVAHAKGVRSEGIPILDLLEAIAHHLYGSDHKVSMTCYEDNEATERIIINGYSPNLRHMGRVHGVSIGRINESYFGDNPIGTLQHCKSENMKADVFTKSFIEPAKWEHAVGMIGINN